MRIRVESYDFIRAADLFASRALEPVIRRPFATCCHPISLAILRALGRPVDLDALRPARGQSVHTWQEGIAIDGRDYPHTVESLAVLSLFQSGSDLQKAVEFELQEEMVAC